LLDIPPDSGRNGGDTVGMTDAEKRDFVISALEATQKKIETSWQYGQNYINEIDFHAVKDAVALLKEQSFRMMTFEEAHILSLEEIEAYLIEEDSERNPLWVQWKTNAVVGGWVLSHSVADLMWRYESLYEVHLVLWTNKPTEEQQNAVRWRNEPPRAMEKCS